MGAKERMIGKVAERAVVRAVDGRYQRGGVLLQARTGRQHRGGPDSPDVIHNVAGTHWEVTRDSRVRPHGMGMTGKLMKAAGETPGGSVPWVIHRPKGDRRWRVTVAVISVRCVGGKVHLEVVNPTWPEVCEAWVEVTMLLPDALALFGWRALD